MGYSEQGHQLLTAAGYQQYETSAYSKPGYQCQHNRTYWRFGDYIGIGCGAHGKVTFPDGRILRTTKTRHPRGFMQERYLESQRDVEAADKPFEFMNRFRLLEAAPRVEFSQYTGLSEASCSPTVRRGYRSGLSHRMCRLLADNGTWEVVFKFVAGAFSGGVNSYCRMRRACTQHPATTHASSQKLLNHPIAPQLFGIFFPAFISLVDIVNFHQNRRLSSTVYF